MVLCVDYCRSRSEESWKAERQHLFKTAGEVVFGSGNRTCRLGGSYMPNEWKSGKVFVKNHRGYEV